MVVTHPVEVDDSRGLYRLLGALFGRRAQAKALCRDFDAAAASLAAAVPTLPERRVLYLIWKDPWMTVSPATYIARMLAQAHWQVVGGDGRCALPGGQPR